MRLGALTIFLAGPRGGRKLWEFIVFCGGVAAGSRRGRLNGQVLTRFQPSKKHGSNLSETGFMTWLNPALQHDYQGNYANPS